MSSKASPSINASKVPGKKPVNNSEQNGNKIKHKIVPPEKENQDIKDNGNKGPKDEPKQKSILSNKNAISTAKEGTIGSPKAIETERGSPDVKHVSLNGGVSVGATSPSGTRKISLAVPIPGSVLRDSTNTEDDRVSVGSRRDSVRLSLDMGSRKSIDIRAQAAVVANLNAANDVKPKSIQTANDSFIRSAIPCLPLGVSILFLVMNIILPGLGTVLSGFSILCCGKCRVITKDDQVFVTLSVNLWVGACQLFTVPFMFVGWFWSLAWGIKMVIISVDDRREKVEKRERELQSLALSAFGTNIRSMAP